MDKKLTKLELDKKIVEDAMFMFSDGMNKWQIAKIITEKYDKTVSPNSVILRQAKALDIANYVVPEKEHMYKESLKAYEDINDELDTLPEREKALKLKLTSLRDRNELVGLSKSAVSIEINFEGKNYTDNDFLKDRNDATIDIEAVEIPDA